jgi:hypothetical protein
MVCLRCIIVNTLHKGDNKDYYYYYYYYYYSEGVVTKNFLKYLENTDLTKNILRVEQKATNVSYGKQIPRTGPLILVNRAGFLPLIEPSPTDDLG